MKCIDEYAFIALSAYAWSEDLVNKLIEIIRLNPKFNGKIILGGYEVTALKEEELRRIYPDVDFYVKGYSEKALEKIFRNEVTPIVNEKMTEDNIVSLYVSNILLLNSKKYTGKVKEGVHMIVIFVNMELPLK
jgi:hypothetical protein